MTKTLLLIRLTPDKASILEFPSRERAESYIREFRGKYGPVDYVITVSRAKGQRRASRNDGQMRMRYG